MGISSHLLLRFKYVQLSLHTVGRYTRNSLILFNLWVVYTSMELGAREIVSPLPLFATFSHSERREFSYTHSTACERVDLVNLYRIADWLTQ